MTGLSRQVCGQIGRLTPVFASLILLPLSASFGEDGAQWFPLRNHNPFLQVYGLPPFQGAIPATHGEVGYSASLDVANHADAGQTATESIVIDGESYFLNLSVRYGAARWLELGIDMPLVAHTDGFLDNAIEGWHELWGISNVRRSGPGNQLRFFYVNPAVRTYELTSRTFGIGDVQLTAAVPLWKSSDPSAGKFALRSSIKLPTGDEETLRGSAAFDFSLGLYASDSATLAERDLNVSGFAGVLLPGKGDIFPALQRSAVAFGGVAAAWQLTNQFSVAAQMYAQDAYFDSDLDELGGRSVQLAVGGTYRLPRRRVSLAFALVEDVFSDATADVALHFSVRGYSGK